MQRRSEEHVWRKILWMQLPGKRRKGRPEQRYRDGYNEDMNVAGVTLKDASDSSSGKKQSDVVTLIRISRKKNKLNNSACYSRQK